MLKVVFIGDMEIGTAMIEALIESKHELVGVVNKIEKKGLKSYLKRAKQALQPDNTDFLIKKNNIPVITTKGANSTEFRRKVKELAPDVILVSSWGEILQKETIDLAKTACVNCHAALLPRHKGPNPWSSVIRQAEPATGITYHLVSEVIDSGDILLQEKISISPHDTPASIQVKCILLAKQTVEGLLDALEKNEISPVKQDKEQSSYFRGLRSTDGAIDWKKPADEIYRHIRAVNDFVPCYMLYENKKINIVSAQIVPLNTPSQRPGQILARHNNFLFVSTGDPDNGLLIELADRIKLFETISKLRARFLVDRKAEIDKLLSPPPPKALYES